MLIQGDFVCSSTLRNFAPSSLSTGSFCQNNNPEIARKFRYSFYVDVRQSN